MVILTGLSLVVWGVASFFIDLPLLYKCLAPIEILVGLGVMLMGAGGVDDTPTPYPQGEPGAKLATWDDAKTCAMEAEQLDADMGRLEDDHYGVVRGLEKSTVDEEVGGETRQVVVWK